MWNDEGKGLLRQREEQREGWAGGWTGRNPSVQSVPSLTEGTLSAGPGLGEPGAP